MTAQELIEGTVKICRDNVSGWATDDGGTNHVWPEFPPLDLSQSEYPRGMVDVISSLPLDQDVEQKVHINEAVVQVTVFSTNTLEATSLADDVEQAMIDYHDQTDGSGNEYLPNWWLMEVNGVSDMLSVETDVDFMRFQRSVDFTLQTYKTKN